MKLESHRRLGRYLAGSYLSRLPRRQRRAFLLGCVQPDKNPATYLKGSLREQWLRGHNYDNAKRYMRRLSARLERRQKLRLMDFYMLGKLVHYTADAFTAPHNAAFSEDLHHHRAYEAALQRCFLAAFPELPCHVEASGGSIMDTIRAFHREYLRCLGDLTADCQYTIVVCSTIVHRLFPLEPIPC